MTREGETELARLEADLADLLEERQLNMARPMRGVVRDALTRQYQRSEERLRARIAALRDGTAAEVPAEEEER